METTINRDGVALPSFGVHRKGREGLAHPTSPPSFSIDADLKKALESALHERLIRNCRKDPNQFINYALGYNNKKWYGQGELHIKWQKALNDFFKVLIVCPREHGKTNQIVIGRAIWEIGTNPNIRAKLVCQSDDIAIKRLSAIVDHILNNPRVKEIFPDLIPAEKQEWSKTKIHVKRDSVGSIDPTLEACGILSSAVGGRADLLIFDDPVDFRNAIQQPALREMVKEVYLNVWMQILEVDGGRVWYVATPWHQADLTHFLLESPDNVYHKITDSIDEKFTPIWPQKWTKKRLMDKLTEIGKRAFDRAFRNKALADEDQLFPEYLMEKCYDDTFKFGKLPAEANQNTTQFFTGVDIAAGKTRTDGAYSVIFTIAVCDGKKIPVRVTRGRFTSPMLAQLVVEEIQEYNPVRCFVENNAQQEALIQWIQETSNAVDVTCIEGFFTGMQKRDEALGLPSMAVEFDHQSWRIPNPKLHETGCRCNLCLWVNEMQAYPLGKYKDLVMSSWFAKEAARKSAGFSLGIRSIFGDDDETTEIEEGLVTIDERPFMMNEDDDNRDAAVD
jgi:hypothetical protein